MPDRRWPRRLVICGIPYRVVYRPQLEKDGEHGYWGLIQPGQRLISIATANSDDTARTREDIFAAMLHEILHGLASETGIINQGLRKSIDEEAFIKELATLLADTLVRNKLVRLGAK